MIVIEGILYMKIGFLRTTCERGHVCVCVCVCVCV